MIRENVLIFLTLSGMLNLFENNENTILQKKENERVRKRKKKDDEVKRSFCMLYKLSYVENRHCSAPEKRSGFYEKP